VQSIFFNNLKTSVSAKYIFYIYIAGQKLKFPDLSQHMPSTFLHLKVYEGAKLWIGDRYFGLLMLSLAG